MRQLAERTSEQTTQQLIAECRRFIESLEDMQVFWLEVLRKSLQADSRSGSRARSVRELAEEPSLFVSQQQGLLTDH